MPPAPKRKLRGIDYDPLAIQDDEDDLVEEEENAAHPRYSDYDSEWSEADSEDLSGDSDAEGKDAAGTSSRLEDNKSHKKERREVWQSLQEPWMKIGYFLELGDRFSIVERGAFYVVVRDPRQKPGYLGNKAKLLEENGFVYSEQYHRWQKRISEGKHELETWRPVGHSYDKAFFKDEFDEFS